MRRGLRLAVLLFIGWFFIYLGFFHYLAHIQSDGASPLQEIQSEHGQTQLVAGFPSQPDDCAICDWKSQTPGSPLGMPLIPFTCPGGIVHANSVISAPPIIRPRVYHNRAPPILG